MPKKRKRRGQTRRLRIKRFMNAIMDGNFQLVKTMYTEYPSLLNARSYPGDGSTVLRYAICYSKNPDIIFWLIDKGADVNFPSGSSTPLCDAVIIQNEAIVTMLLDAGADRTLKNHDGWTALCLAATLNDNSPILDQLLQGSDAEMLRKQDIALAMRVAVGHGHLNNMKRLLDADPSIINSVEPGSGRTVLHKAVEKKYLEILRELVLRKADVYAIDGEGHRPLWRAIVLNRVRAVRILLSAYQRQDVLEALLMASNLGRLRIVKLIAAYDLSLINQVYQIGESEMCALERAIKNHHDEVVKFLIESGADCTKRINGETLLYQAVNSEMLIKLIQLIVSSSSQEKTRSTAYFCSVVKKQMNCINALIKASGEEERAIAEAYFYAITTGQFFIARLLQVCDLKSGHIMSKVRSLKIGEYNLPPIIARWRLTAEHLTEDLSKNFLDYAQALSKEIASWVITSFKQNHSRRAGDPRLFHQRNFDAYFKKRYELLVEKIMEYIVENSLSFGREQDFIFMKTLIEKSYELVAHRADMIDDYVKAAHLGMQEPDELAQIHDVTPSLTGPRAP